MMKVEACQFYSGEFMKMREMRCLLHSGGFMNIKEMQLIHLYFHEMEMRVFTSFLEKCEKLVLLQILTHIKRGVVGGKTDDAVEAVLDMEHRGVVGG
ncbi:unnamed protein product [Victoria cruziana]